MSSKEFAPTGYFLRKEAKKGKLVELLHLIAYPFTLIVKCNAPLPRMFNPIAL